MFFYVSFIMLGAPKVSTSSLMSNPTDWWSRGSDSGPQGTRRETYQLHRTGSLTCAKIKQYHLT